MTTVNPIKDQLSHITVDYDAQGRLVLDNQGKKYEVTLENIDGQGHATQLTLQRNAASTNTIKALIADLFKAHVVHDQDTSDVQQMNRQGLQYVNGTLKNHDFLIWDKNAQDMNRNTATQELVHEVAPYLQGTWVDEFVKTQDVWNRLEELVATSAVPTSSQPTSTSSTNSTEPPLQPQQGTTTPDPLRRINPSSSSSIPLSFTQTNPFEATDEVEADITINDSPLEPSSPLPSTQPKKQADPEDHSTKISFQEMHSEPKKKSALLDQQEMDALIHKLETSTFEEVNIGQKPNETTMDKIGRGLRQARLETTGAWGTKDIQGNFTTERACIRKYKSTLTDLISFISEGAGNERRELPKKIKAFYEALKARAEQIAGNDKYEPKAIQSQAALIRAGIQELVNKIREQGADPLWRSKIPGEIFKYARLNLHREISPDELLATGNSPTDYLNEKLALYNEAIGKNTSSYGFKMSETLPELIDHVMQEVQQERGTVFQEKIDELEKLRSELPEEDHTSQQEINTQIAYLRQFVAMPEIEDPVQDDEEDEPAVT